MRISILGFPRVFPLSVSLPCLFYVKPCTLLVLSDFSKPTFQYQNPTFILFLLILRCSLYANRELHLLFRSKSGACLVPQVPVASPHPGNRDCVPAMNMLSPSPAGKRWHRVTHSPHCSLVLTRMCIACLGNLDSQTVLKMQSRSSFPLGLTWGRTSHSFGEPYFVKCHHSS